MQRPGECAAEMSEQFAFDERRSQRAAIHRNERPVAPRADFVNRAGHQFFARPALAQNQHRRAARGHFLNHLEDLLHLWRLAHHWPEMIARFEPLAQVTILVFQDEGLCQAPGQRPHPFGCKRLDDVFGRPLFSACTALGTALEGAMMATSTRGFLLFSFSNMALWPAPSYVGNNDVHWPLLHHFHRLRRRLSRQRAVAQQLDDLAARVAHRLLIVNDEDAELLFLIHCLFSRDRGSTVHVPAYCKIVRQRRCPKTWIGRLALVEFSRPVEIAKAIHIVHDITSAEDSNPSKGLVPWRCFPTQKRDCVRYTDFGQSPE